MTWPHRVIGFLMAVRDFCPLITVAALLVLPIALIPTESDEFSRINAQYPRTWLRALFLAVRFTHKINDIIVYGHVGLQRVIKFQSNEIWVAPCETPIPPITHNQSPLTLNRSPQTMQFAVFTLSSQARPST